MTGLICCQNLKPCFCCLPHSVGVASTACHLLCKYKYSTKEKRACVCVNMYFLSLSAFWVINEVSKSHNYRRKHSSANPKWKTETLISHSLIYPLLDYSNNNNCNI